MNRKKFLVFKFSFFSAVLLSFFLTALSCGNLFTDITPTYTPSIPTGEGTLSAVSGGTVTLTGKISDIFSHGGAVPAEYAALSASLSVSAQIGADELSRSAVPTKPTSDITYTASAETVEKAADGTGTTPLKTAQCSVTTPAGSAPIVSVPLPVDYTWRITVTMKHNDDTVLSDVYTMESALSATNPVLSHDFVLKPLTTGSGTISLHFSNPNNAFDTVLFASVTKNGVDKFSEWNDAVQLDSDSASIVTKSDKSLPCGAYDVLLNFKKDGIIVYSTTQTINVFPNMVTDKWVTSLTDSDGALCVTQPMVESFALTQLYVGANPSVQKRAPSDNNPGTPYAPLATLGAALSRLTDSTKDYTIHISGEHKGNFTLGDGLNGKAKSLTLCGMTGNTTDILDGDADGDNIGDDSVLTIATTVPITIRNLKITGGNATTNNEGRGQGGGIDVFMDGATITLDRGAFITENVAKIQGGGVYVFGKNNTLVMNDGSKISNNHITDCNTNYAAYGGVGVYFGCDYNNTAEDARPTFTMNGGEISGHTCGSESSPVAAVSGMGLRLCKAVFIMNDGKITENKAVSDYRDKTLGGNIYAERSTMEIKGGEISKGSIQITNNYASAGAIWLDNTSLTMTGGKIIDNFVKPGSGQAGNGGAIVSWNGSTIEITGGEISGNYIDTEDITKCVGGAIHLGSTAGSIKIGGNAYIPEGADSGTGFGKNDIFLLSESKVVIIKSHLSKTQTIALSLRSDSCTNGAEVLTLDTGANTTIPNEYQKFKMNNEGFIIGSDGKLKPGMMGSAAEAVNAIENLSDGGTVIVTGAVSSDNLTAINSKLQALATSHPEARITIDLSNVTGLKTLPKTAFTGCTNIVSVTLPNTVTALADGSSESEGAFSGCTNLTTVVLPDGLSDIGRYSFFGCTSLASIDIPDTVTRVYDFSFKGCSALTEVELPDGMTYLGQHAFMNCTNLAEVNIPSGVTTLPQSAFAHTAITSIEIPSTVQTLGGCVFTDTKLTSVTIPSSVTSIGMQCFNNCKDLENVRFEGGSTITAIADGAFGSCSKLTSINLPDTVTSIDKNAFYGCTVLSNVTIPYAVTSIGESAFRDCKAITEIEIPSGVTEIKDFSFQGCNNLQTVQLHSNITTIGTKAFYGCSKLSSINLPNGLESIGSNAFWSCSALTSIELPNSLKTIGGTAFQYCGLTSIEFPDGLESIGSEAFKNCNGLTEVTIPGSVTSIAGFGACTNLTTVIIGGNQSANEQTIQAEAFTGCGKLVSVSIPSTVTSIGNMAFMSCATGATLQISYDGSDWDDVSVGGLAFNSTSYTVNGTPY